MKTVLPLMTLVGVAMSRTEVMLPLYAPPSTTSGGVNPNWQAAFDAISSNQDLHFYVVINPNSGPKNTSSPGNRGSCNLSGGDNLPPLDYGCNRDWSSRLNDIHKFPNVQTLGYVYTGYGTPQARAPELIEEDIRDYAKWDTAPTWDANVPNGNIRINGIWFDEVGVLAGNKTGYTRLTNTARDAFKNRENPGDCTLVMNPGSNPEKSYEADLYAMSDAVVVRETCYTNLATAPDGDCPGRYAPYEYRNLTQGCGLPFDDSLRSKTVNIVHQFHGPRPADEAALNDQIRGAVGLGLHSFYVSGGTWQETQAGTANIGTVSRLLSAANKATDIPPPGDHAGNGVCLTNSVDWPNSGLRRSTFTA